MSSLATDTDLLDHHRTHWGGAGVSGQMDLQELVLTRLAALGDKGRAMSARAAAARSKGGVSYDTIYAIARGGHSGQLTDRVAQGLADALEVPVGQVYDAAGVPRPQSRWVLPDRFDRLDLAQRKLVEEVAAALLEATEKGRRNEP